MEQALTSDARPIPEHVVDGRVRFDHAGLLTEEDRREMIRRIQLDLLRTHRERAGGCRAAEKDDERPPPHSRTSLARATNTSDKEIPSDAAAFRLTAM